jgi:hypothetical protein
MYSYLYDAALGNSGSVGTLAKIEARLTNLGINGKINRLTFLKNIPALLAEEKKRGLKNLVVVGNDQTFNQVLNLVGDTELTLGFIPVGQPQKLASLLGIGDLTEACDILAARKIEKIDVGVANGYYFLTSFTLPNEPLILECDKSYFLTLENFKNKVSICNLDFYQGRVCSPRDGQLEIIVNPPDRWSLFKHKEAGNHSRLLVSQINLSCKKSAVIKIDENKALKTPVNITVQRQKLSLIVGKKRPF